MLFIQNVLAAYRYLEIPIKTISLLVYAERVCVVWFMKYVTIFLQDLNNENFSSFW